MSKRYVPRGDGSQELVTNADVAANLREQGFAPGLASQISADHERIQTTKPKVGMKPQKAPKIPTTMEWELPDSGARL